MSSSSAGTGGGETGLAGELVASGGDEAEVGAVEGGAADDEGEVANSKASKR